MVMALRWCGGGTSSFRRRWPLWWCAEAMAALVRRRCQDHWIAPRKVETAMAVAPRVVVTAIRVASQTRAASGRFAPRAVSGGGGCCSSVTNQMSNSVIPFYTPEDSLRLINTKWKLKGQNFPVWKMHLDNVLRAQGKLLIMKEILSLNQSVKDHLIEMRRLFKCLTRLGYKMTQEELLYLIWYSLPKEICDTASAYMKEPKTDVAKVHEDILASLEPKPAPAELMDSDWIDELGDLSCPECGSQDICEHSMNIDQIEIGLPDAPGIFMIDFLITSYESWVIDTGSGNHICNHLQGFTRRETLRKDRSNLRVGEGTPLIAEAVGSYSFSLPSGLVLELENCYYVPKMIKNMTKEPFNKDNERATDLLEIVHTDVCRPFSHEARGGYRYFITFTDDFSRYGYVYRMRHKSESFEKFREYQNEVQNQLDRKIKFLRSDRGGEYLSQEFGNHLMECGIVSQLTPPYTPQMNGVSERRNRTLLDMVYVKRPTSEKLIPKSDKCFFVGYPKTTVGYYFYNPEENKVFVARNGKFLEEKFLSTGNTREDVDLQIVDEDNTVPTVEPDIHHKNVEPQSEPIEEVQTQDLRRSTRVRQEPDRYLGFLVSQVGGDLNEPTFYGEAVSGSESEQWQETMKAEMQSMYDNQVWELTDLPQHCRAVGRKWVFKKKTDMDGNMYTFKARLVAKGFTQTHGIDYDETFSPVAMLKSIRILMAISAYFNYEIWQMDVKTAFLNGKLIEDMKDLGDAAYILGIKIYGNRSKRLIGLSQCTYIDKILKKFRMDESKKGFIPMQHGIVLSKTQCPVSSQDQDKMKSVPYASAIGSIMYAMLCTRPDVAYSISVTSRYQHNPGEPHWVVVKNILQYLRRTKDIVVASISRPIDIFYDNFGVVVQAKEPKEHHKSRHVLRKYHLIREIIGREDVRICKIPTEDNVADLLTKPLARVKHEAHACSIGMQYLDASS
ncbi:hypothetical protein OSB04_000725 [Centaurea solstitialis]|uniref:Integrase catalytic domain-containing protein n=1 Tax=Centaurea solstitialis TaxID=347529 RepID=A0AA38TRF5_9ASTR|nr:hypothetical protein OSB04_000725 [Centaurea solstitialis]